MCNRGATERAGRGSPVELHPLVRIEWREDHQLSRRSLIWIEEHADKTPAPLDRWQPPPAWGVGAHAKHLRNLYVYFWRWATWKVFGDGATDPQAAPGRRKIIGPSPVMGVLHCLHRHCECPDCVPAGSCRRALASRHAAAAPGKRFNQG